MATIEEETFTTVTKDPVVRDRMIRAMHRHSHEHGYLWEPEPGCGCEERIDMLLSDWDDEESKPTPSVPRFPVVLHLDLAGEDGNAFVILGTTTRAMKAAGATPEQCAEYRQRATAGDYENLLAVTREYVTLDDIQRGYSIIPCDDCGSTNNQHDTEVEH